MRFPALSSLAFAFLVLAAACGGKAAGVSGDGGPGSGGDGGNQGDGGPNGEGGPMDGGSTGPLPTANKVDLLFMIDNSA
ncbi:MAG TPA: hypothetical protein VIF09_09445, partial [Polyangiaceae bacterium]